MQRGFRVSKLGLPFRERGKEKKKVRRRVCGSQRGAVFCGRCFVGQTGCWASGCLTPTFRSAEGPWPSHTFHGSLQSRPAWPLGPQLTSPQTSVPRRSSTCWRCAARGACPCAHIGVPLFQPAAYHPGELESLSPTQAAEAEARPRNGQWSPSNRRTVRVGLSPLF